MRHFSKESISKMPRLSELIFTDDQTFTPEKLITELSLYETVAIDTRNIKCTIKRSHIPYPGSDSYSLKEISVSEDVMALHRFLLFNDSIMLPCPECKREQAFSPSIAFNPMHFNLTVKMNNDIEEEPILVIPTVDQGKVPKGYSTKYNRFDQLTITYLSGKDRLLFHGELKGDKIDTKPAAISCVDGISQYFSEIRRDFVCPLDKSHHITAYFTIHKATEVCKDKLESDEYEKLKYCLILEKVGQEPSMADLQLFDIKKYRKALTSERFRDFSMAIGLNASGVGCGALLYLRRVFESIVEESQKQCETLDGWDQGAYSKKRFKEKINYLESFGKKIIPDEISPIKDKIYGCLSKGVHELSEEESLELFPYLKIAIEVILDEQLAQNDKERRIKEINKKLGSISTQ